MLRGHEPQPINWANYTLSKIRHRQAEKSRKHIEQAEGISLFGCTDEQALRLWEGSFYKEEQPCLTHLYAADELRARVLGTLSEEYALLSDGETEVVEKILHSGGQMNDPSAIGDPVVLECLLKRMWCCVRKDQSTNGKVAMQMDTMLALPLMMIAMSEPYREIRKKLYSAKKDIQDVLEQVGALPEDAALNMLWDNVLKGTYCDDERFAKRWLHTTFDYIPGLLVHQGMADPYGFRDRMRLEGLIEKDMIDQTMAEDLYCSMEDNRELVASVLCDVLRPEMNPVQTAYELQLLARQGVSEVEMEQVLHPMLLMAVTPAVRGAIRLLKSSTPCWGRFPSGVVN